MKGQKTKKKTKLNLRFYFIGSIVVFIIWLLLEYQIFNKIFYVIDLSTLLQLFTTVLLTVIVLKNDIKNTNLQATAVLSHYDTTVEKLIIYMDAIDESLGYLEEMKLIVERYHETFINQTCENTVLKDQYKSDYQSRVNKLKAKNIDIKYCINHIRLYDESIINRPAIKLLWADCTALLNYELDGVASSIILKEELNEEIVESGLKFKPISEEDARAYFKAKGLEYRDENISDEFERVFIPGTVQIHKNFKIMNEVYTYLETLVNGLIDKNNAVRQDILKNSLEIDLS